MTFCVSFLRISETRRPPPPKMEDKKAQQRESEAFQGDSAAMRMLCGLFRRPNVVLLGRSLTEFAAASIGTRVLSQVACVGPFLSAVVSKLQESLLSPIPEVVIVIQALRRGNASHFIVPLLFWRCFFQDLAQASLLGAKALRLITENIPLDATSELLPLSEQLKVNLPCIFYICFYLFYFIY